MFEDWGSHYSDGTEYQVHRRCLLGFLGSFPVSDRKVVGRGNGEQRLSRHIYGREISSLYDHQPAKISDVDDPVVSRAAVGLVGIRQTISCGGQKNITRTQCSSV